MDDTKVSQQNDIPAYMKEFLKETPSAISKLSAAWDGLSTETQIKILEEMTKGSFCKYFTDKVNLMALKSKNTYVRYLAAKGLGDCSEAKAL